MALLFLVSCSRSCSSTNEPEAPSPTEVWRHNSIHSELPFARVPAPSDANSPRRGGRAVIAIISEPDSLNPFTSTVREAHEIQDQIYPHLALEEPDYHVGPPSFEAGLAESWTASADGLSIRFRLRETSWSDGTPVRSDDVRFTWQAAVSPEVAWSSAASIAGEIEDVAVHSDREFTVHFRRRSPYQLMDVSDLRVIPRHVYERIPFGSWKTHGRFIEEARVSAGPWRLKSHRPNEEIVLEPNPSYWEKGKPYLDELVFRVVPDTSLQVDWLRAGDVDFIRLGTPDRAKEIIDDPGLRLVDFASRGFGAIFWNTTRAPLDEALVRRAIGHAVHRENIVDALLSGYASVPRSHLLSSFWAFASDLPPLDHSPEAAAKLLTEAGYSRGADGVLERDGKRLSIELNTNAGNTLRQKILELVQSDLRVVGIEARVSLLEGGVFMRSLRTREFDGALSGMNVATKVDLRAAWHSAGIEDGFNFSGFHDARVDELIDEARSMLDLDASRPLWQEIQRRLWEAQPSLMLYERRELVAMSKRIVNVRMTSLRGLDNSHEWWLAPATDDRAK